MAEIPEGPLEACAAEPCEHHWQHHCYRGVSIGICSLCGSPNWDELLQDKHDRDRLWRCLFNAQADYIDRNDGKAHIGWQVALVQTGAPT